MKSVGMYTISKKFCTLIYTSKWRADVPEESLLAGTMLLEVQRTARATVRSNLCLPAFLWFVNSMQLALNMQENIRSALIEAINK